MPGVECQIEAALEADAEVARAVVVQACRAGVPRLVGFVQRTRGACRPDGRQNVEPPDERAELDSVFRERISRALSVVLSGQGAAAPVISVVAIPLDSQGEPDRTALAQRADDFLESLEVLTGIWAEVLGSSEINAEDSFLSHGGSSLAAMRAANRVRDRLGVRPPLSVLLSGRTAADIAACIASDNLDTLEDGHTR